MQCHSCNFLSCFLHDVPWHQGLTCSQFDERSRNSDDHATQALLDADTKQCPRCYSRITKNGGCDRTFYFYYLLLEERLHYTWSHSLLLSIYNLDMTCHSPGCLHEFCWLCVADYESILHHGNHFHSVTCTYYAPFVGDDETGDSEEDSEEDAQGSDGGSDGSVDDDVGDQEVAEDVADAENQDEPVNDVASDAGHGDDGHDVGG